MGWRGRPCTPQGRVASFGSGAHCRPPMTALHDVAKRKVASVRDRWVSVHLDAAPGVAPPVRRIGEDADLELGAWKGSSA